MDADIAGCFDTISHEFLLDAIDTFPARSVIERWLKCGYMDKSVFHHTTRGTPQRGVISPLLANIALDGMDAPLGINYDSRGAILGDRALIRYADDFIVLCATENDAEKTVEVLRNWLSTRGLTLSKEKTRIVHVEDGFDFLGTTVRRFTLSDGTPKLIIRPSKKSILKCRSKLKVLWAQAYGNPASFGIRRINSFIRGWANYSRHYVSKEIFSSLDDYNFHKGYRFARRTHPKKSKRWCQEKYFGRFNRDHKDR